MGIKNKPYVVKPETIPLQDAGSVDRKQLVDDSRFSVTWMIKKRLFENRYSKAEHYNVMYYILNDGGYVLINGVKTSVNRGDTVVVPQGQEYFLSEGVECVAFCEPGFNRT